MYYTILRSSHLVSRALRLHLLLQELVMLFSSIECPYISTELVNRLNVLVLFYTVKDDSTTSLEVSDSIFEYHCANGDADVHFLCCKVNVAYCSCVDSSFFLLEFGNELNGANLGCS